MRDLEHGPGRHRVAGDNELPTGPRRAEHRVRCDRAPVRKRHGVSALERAAFRPGRDAERIGLLDVEAARSRMLEQGVTDRGDAVGNREGDEVVVAALEDVTRAQLVQVHRIGELPEDPLRTVNRFFSPGGP
jgi:hypothetical protein